MRPKQTNDLARQKEIGKRLRAFREFKMIPRARLAVAIGIGSERLASYESGRAPLRYDVFRKLAANFGLSARWLALGKGGSSEEGFDDSAFLPNVPDRATFTAAYDQWLAVDEGKVKRASDEWFESQITDSKRDLEQLLKMSREEVLALPEDARNKLIEANEKVIAMLLSISGERTRMDGLLKPKRKSK